MNVLVILLVACTSFSALAETIQPGKVTVNPAHIIKHAVLQQNKKANVYVQLVEETLHGVTGVDNNSRLVLSISRLGDLAFFESSFVLSESMGTGFSVKQISKDKYEVTFTDASMTDGRSFTKVININVGAALREVSASNCEDFKICSGSSAVTVD